MQVRSICFFMVYHDRPSLTKMSIDDMLGAMQYFSDEGHDVQAIVIGDSFNIQAYCNRRGIRHEMFENNPIPDKFAYAWLRAVQAQCDYICWWGSNNVHGAGYLAECNEVLKGSKVATFGTTNCVIVSAFPEHEETCLFTPKSGYLISSGQFFLTHTIQNTINPLTIFQSYQTFAFDGSIMDSIMIKWGRDVVQTVVHDEEDCLDIKNGVNIHSYESYMRVDKYPRHALRQDLRKRHPSLDLYLDGYFD